MKRAKVEFSQSNGRNERKRGSVHQNTQPPRSGTAVLMDGFPLGARFCNYDMQKLDIRPNRKKTKSSCLEKTTWNRRAKKHANSQRTYPDAQFHLRDCRWKTCSDSHFNTGIPKATAEFSSPCRTRCRPPRCTSLGHPLSACVFCFSRRLQKCISCR